jgi:hypothetical protein
MDRSYYYGFAAHKFGDEVVMSWTKAEESINSVWTIINLVDGRYEAKVYDGAGPNGLIGSGIFESFTAAADYCEALKEERLAEKNGIAELVAAS